MPVKPPKDLDALRKNKKFTAAYLDYAKRRYCLNEVKFVWAKGNPEGLYERYLSPKSKEEVNVSNSVKKLMQPLVAANDFKSKEWGKILDKARDEVYKMLMKDFMQFLSSPEWAAAKMGDPTKAAKILGIKDVKKLKEFMVAAATNDPKKKKLWAAIQKKEGVQDPIEVVLKNMEKAGLI